MISSKYSVTIIVLATFALIPVTIHTYLGSTFMDGRSTGSIDIKLLNLYSQPTNRDGERVERVFAAKDWIERSYIGTSGKKITLFVARSYDYKKLYHHPEIALMGSLKLAESSFIKIKEFNDLPVHTITSGKGDQSGLIAYSMLVGENLVGNPYLYQLINSFKSLLKSTQPMTLFFVFDPSYSGEVPIGKTVAVGLLNEAIRSFREVKSK